MDDEGVLCSCFPVEDPWTYYGIVEPGGAFEPNPECPVHFPEGTAQIKRLAALTPTETNRTPS